jgi:hypothetical protein
MAPRHIGHGSVLVYIVVRAAASRSRLRAAQSAVFSSGWAVMSLSVSTVLRSSTSTSPSGPTSSDPNGMSPAARASAASSIARRRWRSSVSAGLNGAWAGR